MGQLMRRVRKWRSELELAQIAIPKLIDQNAKTRSIIDPIVLHLQRKENGGKQTKQTGNQQRKKNMATKFKKAKRCNGLTTEQIEQRDRNELIRLVEGNLQGIAEVAIQYPGKAIIVEFKQDNLETYAYHVGTAEEVLQVAKSLGGNIASMLQLTILTCAIFGNVPILAEYCTKDGCTHAATALPVQTRQQGRQSVFSVN